MKHLRINLWDLKEKELYETSLKCKKLKKEKPDRKKAIKLKETITEN